jgi:hypothetical protein
MPVAEIFELFIGYMPPLSLLPGLNCPQRLPRLLVPENVAGDNVLDRRPDAITFFCRTIEIRSIFVKSLN